MGLVKGFVDVVDYVFTWFLAGLLLDVLYQAVMAFILVDMDWTQMVTFRPNFDKLKLIYKVTTQAYWFFNP